MITLLAIVGRGIQMEKGNPMTWWPTADLEIMEEDGTHSPFRNPCLKNAAKDRSRNCMIGGGELNLLAGLELIKIHQPRVVVCAYGPRPPYLKKVDGPNESEVMSHIVEQFAGKISGAVRGVPDFAMPQWSRHRDMPGPSNTNTEIRNVLDLAIERSTRRIGIVTVNVHLPRTVLFTQEHLASERFKDQNLEVRFFSSEQVLMETDPKKYAERVAYLNSSRAYRRNAEREARGVKAILDGTYGQGLAGGYSFKNARGR